MNKNIKTSDVVFNYIEEKILNGEWKPGNKISTELQLVKDLNVSRMSVREAIEKLVALKLLTKKRGDGTYVNEITPGTNLQNLIPLLTMGKKSYMEILQIRTALDVLCIDLFMKNWDLELVKQLEDLHYKILNSTIDDEKLLIYDKKFHKIISLGTKNTLLLDLNEILFHTLEFYAKSEYNKINTSKRLEEHGKILDAIKNKDSELAKLYMKRHIDETILKIKENSN
ncbi:FadR/GntR family transcriptional regulator [uncultured Ilyobacter sp.]|uniref:FadR/GntR family transcriptional regulator n=1 Tax=uncultured Ilyobacter sp. TaxID=544433 RepID=UPI0029C93AEB|nr:FadR/GntR family transcriptional regulator [uncultured Ilyobacter sp.]